MVDIKTLAEVFEKEGRELREMMTARMLNDLRDARARSGNR